jgi:hypothetical protein
MPTMSETSEPSTQPSAATPPSAAAPLQPKADWLYRAAAWVAIIAGFMFTALVILWLVCAFWS